MKKKKHLFVLFVFSALALYSAPMKKMELGKRKFFGVSKKYSVGLKIPLGCVYGLERRRFYRLPIIELKKENQYLITISISRQSYKIGIMKKVYDLLYRYGEQDSCEAGKKSFEIKKIKGAHGRGYYFLVKRDLPPPFNGFFKYASRVIYVMKELRFFVTITYRKNDEHVLEKALDVIRSIQIRRTD